jgi:hypothetical protein
MIAVPPIGFIVTSKHRGGDMIEIVGDLLIIAIHLFEQHSTHWHVWQ